MQPAPVVRIRYRPDERHARHAHDYANVSVVLAGSLQERVGRAEVIARPLSVVVKPAGTEHEDVFGPSGAVMLRMRLPDEWLRGRDEIGSGTERWRWLTSAAAARWLLRLAAVNATRHWSAEDGIAECLGATSELDASRDEHSVPDWLERVHERIRDEAGRRTRVAELAHDAGVHPVYLTRRFRRAFGCSVVACIQAERVRRAADQLATSRVPLSHVAYDAGYADQSHLTRAFVRASGVTPAEYRDLAQGRAEVGSVQERGGHPA